MLWTHEAAIVSGGKIFLSFNSKLTRTLTIYVDYGILAHIP